jgi:hypothetical protein
LLGVGRQLGDGDVERSLVAQLAHQAQIVQPQQLGAGLRQALAHRGRHEGGTQSRFGVQGQVVGAVDAGELHAAERDAARALGVGGELCCNNADSVLSVETNTRAPGCRASTRRVVIWRSYAPPAPGP